MRVEIEAEQASSAAVEETRLTELPPREQAEARVARHVTQAAAKRLAINANVSAAREDETAVLAVDSLGRTISG
jgi:hypothetical protein